LTNLEFIKKDIKDYLFNSPSSTANEISKAVGRNRSDTLRALKLLCDSKEVVYDQIPPPRQNLIPSVKYRLNDGGLKKLRPVFDHGLNVLNEEFVKKLVVREIENAAMNPRTKRPKTFKWEDKIDLRPTLATGSSRRVQDFWKTDWTDGISQWVNETYGLSVSKCAEIMHVLLAKVIAEEINFKNASFSEQQYIEDYNRLARIFLRSLSENLSDFLAEFYFAKIHPKFKDPRRFKMNRQEYEIQETTKKIIAKTEKTSH